MAKKTTKSRSYGERLLREVFLNQEATVLTLGGNKTLQGKVIKITKKQLTFETDGRKRRVRHSKVKGVG